MATPVGGVNDGVNPYAGGTLSRAGRPTGASAEFATPGAPGFPTPGAPNILTARNNKGSNVQIPYSRLVPMHGKYKLPVKDDRLTGTGVSELYEYDGLEAGELAWVMSKQFATLPHDGASWAPNATISALVDHAALAHNIDGASAAAQQLGNIAAAWRTTPPGGSQPRAVPKNNLESVYRDTQTQAVRGAGYTGWVNRLDQPVQPPAELVPNAPGAPYGSGGVGPDGAALSVDAGMGGYGVDRMQRMASTGWIESWFHRFIARQRIDLVGLRIADDQGQNAFLDSDIAFFVGLRTLPRRNDVLNPDPASGGYPPPAVDGYLAGATVLCVPDLAYALQVSPGDRIPGSTGVAQPDAQRIALGHAADPMRMQVQVPMMQGLYVMEQGPFLRSYGADHYPVDIRQPNDSAGNRVRQWSILANPNGGPNSGLDYATTPKLAEVDRHLGSQLAQKGLYCALKKHGVFNWVPDGMCLSKFATGPDGYSDDHFDARTGQLFNVGVQGPCITKTWTGDSSMVAMPGDKLFVLVIGTVNYEVGDLTAALEAADALDNAVLAAVTTDEAGDPDADPTDAVGRDRLQANLRRARELGRSARSVAAVSEQLPRATRAELEASVRALYQANAALTMSIAREKFTRKVYYEAPGAPGGVTVARPNAARYGSVSDIVGAASEREVNVVVGVARSLGRSVETFGQGLLVSTPTNAKKLHDDLVVQLNQLAAGSSPSVAGAAEYTSLKAAAQAALESYASLYGDVARTNVALAGAGDDADVNFKKVAQDVRNGKRPVVRAEVSGIHLKRATSSWMSNTSHFDPMNSKSRCGLKIGYFPDGQPGATPAAVTANIATRAAEGPAPTTEPLRQINPGRALAVLGGGVDPGGGVYSNHPPADNLGATYYGLDGTPLPTADELRANPLAKLGMRREDVPAGSGNFATVMPMRDVDTAPKVTATGLVPGSVERPARTGASEFILGAWCVGTVTDSAASRAAMAHGNLVRTAQHSMAMNANVNIEWWDADKLYQHYMDKDRGHYRANSEDPRLSITRKKGLPLPSAAALAGTGLESKTVLKPEGTVKQRTESTMRTVESIVREMTEQDVQTMSADSASGAGAGAALFPVGNELPTLRGNGGNDVTPGTGYDAIVHALRATGGDRFDEALRRLAVKRLTDGEGDYEGTYIQPDIFGPDTDAKGTRVYDMRERVGDGLARDGYVSAGNAGANEPQQETLVMKDPHYWQDTLANI